MENFDQIFTLIAENNDNITLNLDILETGLINIIALIVILVYVGRDFLGSILETRKNDIVTSVQDAEERFNEANKRLNDAQKQLNQANVIINEIKNETIVTKKSFIGRRCFTIKKRSYNTFYSSISYISFERTANISRN